MPPIRPVPSRSSPTITGATHAAASFHYKSATAQSGTVVLGDIVASVPNTASATYKAKEILQLGSIVVNGSTTPSTAVVSANGIHVDAYFGDVTGNGSIDGLDVATAGIVAQGSATG